MKCRTYLEEEVDIVHNDLEAAVEDSDILVDVDDAVLEEEEGHHDIVAAVVAPRAADIHGIGWLADSIHMGHILVALPELAAQVLIQR